MKKFLLLLLGITFLTQTSEAQLVRSRTFAEKEKTGFNRISVGYDAMFLDHDFGTLNGVNLQYIHGFRIAKVPLFIEVGIDVSYNAKDYTDEYLHSNYDWSTDQYYDYYLETYKEKLNSLSVRIPVNVSYKFNIGDKFSVQPYTGFNFKINPLFDRYYAYKYIEWDEDGYSYYQEDAENKMFQWGWQVGLGFNISKLYVGFQYGLDFLPRASMERKTYIKNYDYYTWSSNDLKSSRLLLSVGVDF